MDKLNYSTLVTFFAGVLIFIACKGGNNGPGETGFVATGGPIRVEIREKDGGYQLIRGEKPYFIKGAVGWDYLDRLAAYGGNSLRSGPRFLNRADSLGLTVMVNLPVKAQRDGFDYDDEAAVEAQFNRIKGIVEENRDHPALLMWAIGNELDHIPGDLDYNLKVWDAVNDIAGMIKEIDPYHPVLTVVGCGRFEKIRDIQERCPNLDLLGINTYGLMLEIPEMLSEQGWTKPYAVTEWGVSGWWEVPRTNWDVVIEETSTEKAELYRKKYEGVVLADPRCIGSYVFLWTSNRQERTHTWFNIFCNGEETQAVETMQYMWTGQWPGNLAPRISSLNINGMSALDQVSVAPGSINRGEVFATDPDQDALQYEWELLPEPTEFGAYAGQGEVKPEAVEGFIQQAEKGMISFRVPAEGGKSYRLFVYIYDGQGNMAVANIPFYVEGS
ncbi:MAG: glycoside hydrolase family 2 TIM barrel-domain containing protein [Bacteroidales bacterium]